MIQISFEYASLVFALNNNQDLEKLQKIQNQALRLSYGYRVSTSINICMLSKLPLLYHGFKFLAPTYFLKVISIRDHPVVTKLLELCDCATILSQYAYLLKNFPSATYFFVCSSIKMICILPLLFLLFRIPFILLLHASAILNLRLKLLNSSALDLPN